VSSRLEWMAAFIRFIRGACQPGTEAGESKVTVPGVDKVT